MSVDILKSQIDWCETFASGYSSATSGQVFGRCNWTGTSGATAAPLAINGGACRLTLGGDDADAAAVFGPLAFEPDESSIIAVQVRLRTSDADKSSIFIGFTDAVTDTVVIEDEDGALNTVATDAFGVLLEGEQDLTLQTIGVQNDTDNAQAAIGSGTGDVAPADILDSTWITVRIEAEAKDSGTMRVYLNGRLIATRTSFLRSSIIFAPVVSADDRGTAYTVDLAEMAWNGQAGAAFD